MRPRTSSLRPWWKQCDFGDQTGYSENLQTKAETAQLSEPKQRWRDYSDQGGDGATKNQFFATVVEAVRLWRSDLRLSRPRRKRRDFLDQSRDGATIQTKAETARPRTNSSQPWWKRCDFGDQSGDGLNKKQFFGARGRSHATLTIRFETFQTKAETGRLSRPMRRWRDYSDQGGDGATKNQFFATVLEAVRLSRSERRLPDQSGAGATFQNNVETA